jgi:hypothetical protein
VFEGDHERHFSSFESGSRGKINFVFVLRLWKHYTLNRSKRQNKNDVFQNAPKPDWKNPSDGSNGIGPWESQEAVRFVLQVHREYL